ncbi:MULTISPECIES: hypothetical protein [Bacteroidales]|uniref:hypothetical protein n=1 Tax=Bacteroidales TaxID=171549 RepID=UPI0025726727|nr:MULTISPECIES: hypothetical protein [Bacteroidales]
MIAALKGCHHSIEPSATRAALSGIHIADMTVSVSHIFRFTLLLNMIFLYQG